MTGNGEARTRGGVDLDSEAHCLAQKLVRPVNQQGLQHAALR